MDDDEEPVGLLLVAVVADVLVEDEDGPDLTASGEEMDDLLASSSLKMKLSSSPGDTTGFSRACFNSAENTNTLRHTRGEWTTNYTTSVEIQLKFNILNLRR